MSKRLDTETGWYYFGKRYYIPELGQFATSDPMGYSEGPNLYSYVNANPLVWIDPYGLFADSNGIEWRDGHCYTVDNHQEETFQFHYDDLKIREPVLTCVLPISLVILGPEKRYRMVCTFPSAEVSAGNIASGRQLNTFGRALNYAGASLGSVHDSLNCVCTILAMAGLYLTIIGPEPVSKGMWGCRNNRSRSG